MSADMYLMKQNYVGIVEDMEFYQSARDSMHEVIRSFLAEDVEIYESRMTDEPRHIRAIIQNQTTDNPMYANLRQIVTECGVNLQCGNYIRYKGDWWVAPYLTGTNGMYEKAYIWYCNYKLRFVSPTTDEIVTYPVHTESATRYNSGDRETAKVRLGTSQHILYIPNNDETIRLEHDMRLLMDNDTEKPMALYISQIDTLSYAYGEQVGLLRITASETLFNDKTDDEREMVADLYKYNNPHDNEGSSFYG